MNEINHVAIIMDGNGRWGLKKFNSRRLGHKQGIKTIEKIIEITLKKKIKDLTLYTFSTENWNRPKYEIDYLFNLLFEYLNKNLNDLSKNNLKLNIIGSTRKLPTELKKILNKSTKLTSKNSKLQINLALNYGSRDEILNSLKLIIKKKLKPSINNIEKYLYTKNIPDPDILIRTGNTHRLSNFLLWQLSYTEIYFVKKFWPDFTQKDYSLILRSYKNIKRKFGKIR
jgi:undecaprenyl diphosphate synthase